MDGEQDQGRVQKYLLEIKEKYNFFSKFFVSAYSSRYYHFKGIHKRINPVDSHDVWYYRFVDSGKKNELYADCCLGLLVSVILTDLDGFRQVNDMLGHLHGDEVLRTISGLEAKVVRPTDILARWTTRQQRPQEDCLHLSRGCPVQGRGGLFRLTIAD